MINIDGLVDFSAISSQYLPQYSFLAALKYIYSHLLTVSYLNAILKHMSTGLDGNADRVTGAVAFCFGLGNSEVTVGFVGED